MAKKKKKKKEDAPVEDGFIGEDNVDEAESSEPGPPPIPLPQAVEEVRAGVEQCAVFATWIQKAQEKQKAFSSDIVTKVIGDYSAKYQAQLDEMQPHVDEIKRLLQEEEDAPSPLDAELQGKEMEREELKLRNMIGELDDEEFEAVAGQLEERIEELTGQLAALTERREALEAALGTAQDAQSVLDELRAGAPAGA